MIIDRNCLLPHIPLLPLVTLSPLLFSNGISLKLAHAKYVKAIAYAKVKTDKVDSHILAQLLRMNFIPEAYKISDSVRPLRDTLRARLRLSQKRTSCLNFMNRMLEKFNITDPSSLSDFNNHFKGIDFENKKSLQWPRITSPDV